MLLHEIVKNIDTKKVRKALSKCFNDKKNYLDNQVESIINYLSIKPIKTTDQTIYVCKKAFDKYYNSKSGLLSVYTKVALEENELINIYTKIPLYIADQYKWADLRARKVNYAFKMSIEEVVANIIYHITYLGMDKDFQKKMISTVNMFYK